MGKLAEMLEYMAADGRPTIYEVPSEEEIISHRVRAETRLVKTYFLSETERLALIEKYGPPMDPKKATAVRNKWRGTVKGFGSKRG